MYVTHVTPYFAAIIACIYGRRPSVFSAVPDDRSSGTSVK